MYRIMLFKEHTWIVPALENMVDLECLEDALVQVWTLNLPWRIQEWIDVRNGPAEASFWRDIRYWIDGVGDLV